MLRFYPAIILLFCASLGGVSYAGESRAGYAVKYAGGTLPAIENSALEEGKDLALFVDSDQIRLQAGRRDVAVIPATAVTEISHGEEIHRKFGKKVGLSATKEYIGLTWDKGSVVLDVDKDEYRGVLLALEGVTGKTTVEKNPHAPHKK